MHRHLVPHIGQAVDIADETFVVADRAEIAAHVAQPHVWREWWPDLRLTADEDRGPQGIRWTVAGELTGTAEIWLEQWHDGVIVHWFLRAEPRGGTRARAVARIRRRYTVSFKSHVHRLKDRFERGRPAGVPRTPPVGSLHLAGAEPRRGRWETSVMAAQTTSSTVIAASPTDIMAVIADLEAYPEWTASVREVRVVKAGEHDGRPLEARFVLDAGPIKDRYTLSYEWTGDEQVRWTLVEGGLIKALEGSYTLAALDDSSTEVTYQLSVDVAIPMLGLMKRKAEKVIIDTALNELKKRVEAIDEDGVQE